MIADREALRRVLEARCLIDGGSHTLSAGRCSSFYFDCKRVLLDGWALSRIADAFLAVARTLPRVPDAIGGPAMAADFIVAAVIQRAARTAQPLVSGSIVRTGRKAHGTGNIVENPLPRGTSILVVDDVLTTGASISRACDVFLTAGHRLAGITVLVDRSDDACVSLARRYGCPVGALFTLSDFPHLRPACDLRCPID